MSSRAELYFREKAALYRQEFASRTALMMSIAVAAALGDVLFAIRRGGPAIVLMAFLLLWTGVVMLIWSIDPHAWHGLGHLVRMGDFEYVAVGSAFGGTPGGIEATAPTARMLLTIETVSGATLIAAYAARLWRGSR